MPLPQLSSARGAVDGRALMVRDARLVRLPPRRHGGGTTTDRQAPPGESAPVDLRIRQGAIVEMGPALAGRGEPEVQAAGAWAIPGLWDRHVHATQAARAASWLDVSGTVSAADVVGRVATHLGRSTAAAAERHRAATELPALLTGFGFRLNAWPDRGTTAQLDAVSGSTPVALISGDAHSGWLNSAAQRLLGSEPLVGPVSEGEWFRLFERLEAVAGDSSSEGAVGDLARHAASRGVTGIVDLEFGAPLDTWPGRLARGLGVWRVRVGVYPEALGDVIERGLHTGDQLAPGGLVTLGPLKIIGDGSLSSRTAWTYAPYGEPGRPGGPPATGATCGAPNLGASELYGLVERAHRHGLAAAVHAIGDRACDVALDAFERSGAHGSIEHAQLVGPEGYARMARLGLTASVQPAHLLDDRDALDRSWPAAGDRCFAFRSLLEAGVELALGSDAPIAALDPWATMAAAVHRSADTREPWHQEQALTVSEALAASVDRQRLGVGARGDLVLLAADPLASSASTEAAAERLRSTEVVATVCAGHVTFGGP